MARRFHYCPVCRKIPVYRAEVKTCGDLNCLATWRMLPRADKIRLMNEAVEMGHQAYEAEVLRGLSPFDFVNVHKAQLQEENPLLEVDTSKPARFDISPTKPNIFDKPPPKKTVQTDNEFLEKIFGPDAPGVVKDEEEDK